MTATTHQLAGHTKAALGAWLLAKRRLEFVRCGLPVDSKKNPLCKQLKGFGTRLWVLSSLTTYHVPHFSLLNQRKFEMWFFSCYFFTWDTDLIYSPRLAHWWVIHMINMRIRSTTVSTSPSYQEIFGLVSPLGFRMEKSGHESVFENTKRWQYNLEINCTLSDNWLLHLHVLAGHIPSPQPTWHE